jgi:hypothetical protein
MALAMHRNVFLLYIMELEVARHQFQSISAIFLFTHVCFGDILVTKSAFLQVRDYHPLLVCTPITYRRLLSVKSAFSLGSAMALTSSTTFSTPVYHQKQPRCEGPLRKCGESSYLSIAKKNS